MTDSLAASLPGVTPQDWARDFLTGLGVPVTPANVDFISKWEALESGGGGGLFNPLNSVQTAPGSTQLNSVGVQNYPDYQTGIAAAVQTWKGSLWGPTVAALGNNDQQGAQDAINAAYKTWGGGPLNITGTPSPPDTVGATLDASSSSSSSTSSAAGGKCPDGCLISLPSVDLKVFSLGGQCLMSRCSGRAWLGAVSLLGGGLLVVVGLGFVTVGGAAGRALRIVVP